MTIMSFMSVQIYISLFSGWLVTSSVGIDCYVCKSEENSQCTESHSFGPPIPAENCSNTDNIIKGWITNHDFMKKGLGEVTLEKIVNFFDDQTSKAADLKFTVRNWVMRDCTTVKIRQETEDSVANKCFPVSGIKDLAKLHFCTCTEDKCNLPGAQVRSLIKDTEKNGIGSSIIRDFTQLLLPTVISVVVAVITSSANNIYE